MLPATATATALSLLIAIPASAQSNWIPPASSDGPGGVTGAARTRDVGFSGPAASQNEGLPATGTSSSSMLKQEMKVDETGVPMYRGQVYRGQVYRGQAVMSDQPTYAGRSGAYIIDEYGNRYDSRGNLIGRGPAPRR
jgi:hypothetical protein